MIIAIDGPAASEKARSASGWPRTTIFAISTPA